MSYTEGFQKHSETSAEAAASIDCSTLRGKILDRLDIFTAGLTIDDISNIFDIVPGTASARMRELEIAGQVIKTKLKRKTRAGRNAFVYVHTDHHRAPMGEAAVKNQKPYDIIKLEAQHGRMKRALDAIVNCHSLAIEDCRLMARKALEDA